MGLPQHYFCLTTMSYFSTLNEAEAQVRLIHT